MSLQQYHCWPVIHHSGSGHQAALSGLQGLSSRSWPCFPGPADTRVGIWKLWSQLLPFTFTQFLGIEVRPSGFTASACSLSHLVAQHWDFLFGHLVPPAEGKHSGVIYLYCAFAPFLGFFPGGWGSLKAFISVELVLFSQTSMLLLHILCSLSPSPCTFRHSQSFPFFMFSSPFLMLVKSWGRWSYDASVSTSRNILPSL